MAEKTILVTVGTTQFDQLVTKIVETETQKVLLKHGYNRMVLQIGRGCLANYKTLDGMHLIPFDYKKSLAADIENADLVISHAGAGSCLEVLEAGKPLLVVINEQLMDNHQTELANALEKRGYVYACTPDTLIDTLVHSDLEKLIPYPKGDSTILINFLDQTLGLLPKT